MKKKLRRFWKKLMVGLKATANIDSTNKTIKVTAATIAVAATATAQAQYYESYNYGGTYYGNNNNTFQNQNTGGYTGAPAPLRSDNWFMRMIMYTLSGLSQQSGTRDPYAPAVKANGGYPWHLEH